MVENPRPHRRRSIRLKDYDYTRAGAYFATLCTRDRARVFGAVADDEMRLNEYGRKVADCWSWLAEQYPYVILDEWVVMPNHFHGIIVITDDRPDGADADAYGSGRGGSDGDDRTDGSGRGGSGRGGSRTAPTGPRDDPMGPRNVPTGDPQTVPPKRKPLGRLIGAFKTVSTKHVNEIRSTPGAKLWQRNYYEHVIRDDSSLRRIHEYIANNPRQWGFDRENPDRLRKRTTPTLEDESWLD